MSAHLSAFYLGDRAYVQQGRFKVPVKVTGFKRNLVEVEYQDGTRGLRPFAALKRR